jgi:DNA repair protein RadC
MIKIPEIKISLSWDKKIKKSELTTCRNSADLYAVAKELFNKDTFDWTEEVLLICLNRANAVIGYTKVSSGGITGTVLDPRVVFAIALNCAATSIVVMHNHPSGNLKPSKGDEDITERIRVAGNALDIKLLDHLIVTDESYYSFRDDGMIY